MVCGQALHCTGIFGLAWLPPKKQSRSNAGKRLHPTLPSFSEADVLKVIEIMRQLSANIKAQSERPS